MLTAPLFCIIASCTLPCQKMIRCLCSECTNSPCLTLCFLHCHITIPSYKYYVLQCVDRRHSEEGLELLRAQWKLYPSLTIKHSTLGESVGLGLFARQDILHTDNEGTLCLFFGNIIIATEEQVSKIQFNFHTYIQFDITL
jgi:hypothetical protein